MLRNVQFDDHNKYNYFVHSVVSARNLQHGQNNPTLCVSEVGKYVLCQAEPRLDKILKWQVAGAEVKLLSPQIYFSSEVKLGLVGFSGVEYSFRLFFTDFSAI